MRFSKVRAPLRGQACTTMLLRSPAGREPAPLASRLSAISTRASAAPAPEGGCRFPGCTARHFVEGHHVEHWAHGGETSRANLVQLCHFHHRLVHEGGYGVRVSGNQQFEFARPDGRVIEAVPKNSAESFRDTDIETLNRENGLDIDARTCVFPGNGARMDHAMAVEELLHRDDALHLDPATGHYPAHFPSVQQHE